MGGWGEFADAFVGINCFGASAPGGTCMEKFGFSVANVVACSERCLKGIQRKLRRLGLLEGSLWQYMFSTRQSFQRCVQGDAAGAGGKGTQAHSVLSQHHCQQTLA